MFRRDVLVPVVGMLLSLVAVWVLAGPRTEIERTRRHFVELQRQVAIARRGQALLWGDAAMVRSGACVATPPC